MGALGELRSGVVHVCVCAKQLLVRANVRQAATDHVHVCNQAACLGLPEPCIYGVHIRFWPTLRLLYDCVYPRSSFKVMCLFHDIV